MVDQLPEHVLQDTTVLKVLHLHIGVQPDLDVELLARVRLHPDDLVNLQVAVLQRNVEELFASQAEVLSRVASGELSGKDTHADEVAPVDALKALGDDHLHALEVGALGSPISRRSRSILSTGKDDELVSFVPVPGSGIGNIHDLSSGNIGCLWPDLGCQLVDDSGVGKGTPLHDLIVSSPRTVCVEVLLLDALRFEVSGGGGVLSDVSGRTDVIGRDRVAEVGEHLGLLDVLDLGQ